MSKMVSHFSFGYLKHKLWPKERARVKLAIWLPTTKSWELTQFPCVQATCDISLKSSWQGLHLCFKLHRDQRFAQEVMHLQSCGVPVVGISGHPLGSLGTKSHLDVALVESYRVYCKGEGGGFPQVRAVVSFVCPNCPWLVLTPKVFQLCIN